MKLLSVLCVLVTLVLCEASAQEISRVNFTQIFATTQNTQSPYFYPSLLKRFQAGDSTLTSVDYSHLYYGYVRQPGYQPAAASIDATTWKNLIAKKEYAAAEKLLASEIQKNPVSLKLAYEMAQLAYLKQDFLAERDWLIRFEGLLQAVMESGDGLTEETAMVVIAPQDEQPVLSVLGVNATASVVTTAKKCNMKMLSTPNEMETEKLYFNVEIPQQYSKPSLGSVTNSTASPSPYNTPQKN